MSFAFQVKSFPCALHRPYYDFVDVDLKHRGSQTKKKLMRKAVKDFAKAKAAQLLKQHFTKKSEDLSRTKFISPKRRLVRPCCANSPLSSKLEVLLVGTDVADRCVYYCIYKSEF